MRLVEISVQVFAPAFLHCFITCCGIVQMHGVDNGSKLLLCSLVEFVLMLSLTIEPIFNQSSNNICVLLFRVSECFSRLYWSQI